jgi:hypothetical protein
VLHDANQSRLQPFTLQIMVTSMRKIVSSWVYAGATALALSGLASPAQAVTCEETRALTPAEVSYWAGRLQVSPQHLATLLDKAFCETAAGRGGVVAQNQRRRQTKADTPSSISD